jgi:deazaflavin-dependent oxidoreductase (nitroreductase family)
VANDYNTNIIGEFRSNQGRIGGSWAGSTLILIHHIGAKSKITRVTPLGCFRQPEGRFAVIASNQGRQPTQPGTTTSRPTPRSMSRSVPKHSPHWPKNLTTPPAPTCAQQLVAQEPGIAEHQTKTTRQIPVFMLTRQN